MVNRLAEASSPYLRQHAGNPVDWFEWGEEAFAKAKAEGKPVFLSVGYSSCHWCHVMAHESFEDETVAKVLNEHFVSVKVDREERPDVDSVYMDAVQAMSGRGGWPMSVFLTPDGVPFFGGTYWPRDDRHGMPGFLKVLDAVIDAWENKRDEVHDTAERLTAHLRQSQELEPTGVERVDPAVAEQAAALCARVWDDRHGGFGRAPKFPQAMVLDFLLAHHLRTGDDGAVRAAAHTLERMSAGGIYDHVGGGFARYSVDDQWLVPHFEKMLYDNALLLRAYTHAWQVTREPRFARVAREVADYLLGDMRHPDGGFYSATDADSEGEEGRFFVWDAAEFDEVVSSVGEDPAEWRAFFGVTDYGNFERRNILHEPDLRDEGDEDFAMRLSRVRDALYERREQRVHPLLDDKVLADWNGLALGALAEAGAVLDEPDYVEASRACATFLRDRLVVDGRLHHTWKEGHGPAVLAFVEDLADLAQGLLVLYEADPDPGWVAWARELADAAERHHADRDTGAYFSPADDAEELLTRPIQLWDNATPAGSSVMVEVHLRLAALTGEEDHRERAEQLLRLFAPRAVQAPTGYGELLRGLERHLAGPREVALVGDPAAEDTWALQAVYREQWRPGAVLAVGGPEAEEQVPLLAGRSQLDGAATAYVCRNFACDRPTADPQELRAQLAAN